MLNDIVAELEIDEREINLLKNANGPLFEAEEIDIIKDDADIQYEHCIDSLFLYQALQQRICEFVILNFLLNLPISTSLDFPISISKIKQILGIEFYKLMVAIKILEQAKIVVLDDELRPQYVLGIKCESFIKSSGIMSAEFEKKRISIQLSNFTGYLRIYESIFH